MNVLLLLVELATWYLFFILVLANTTTYRLLGGDLLGWIVAFILALLVWLTGILRYWNYQQKK